MFTCNEAGHFEVKQSSIGDGVTSAFCKLRSIWISHLHYFFSKKWPNEMATTGTYYHVAAGLFYGEHWDFNGLPIAPHHFSSNRFCARFLHEFFALIFLPTFCARFFAYIFALTFLCSYFETIYFSN